MSENSLRGRLLVAEPVLTDPNFARTVVLLLEHSPKGAIGVVLNRPSAGPCPRTSSSRSSAASAPST